jgi:O-antigen/teichoic acid export membrane protein
MNFKKLLTQSIVWRTLYFATLFWVNVALAHYLRADGTGKIFFISNTFALIQLFAGFCLEGGITYFGASKTISNNKILWLCLLWTLIVSVCLLFILSIWGNSINHLFEGLNVPVSAFCFIIGLTLTNYGCNLFYAHGNFLLPNLVLSIVNGFLLVITRIIYIQFHNIRLITDVYFYFICLQGIAVVTAYILHHKSWKQFQLPDWVDIKQLYRYSREVLAANVLFFLVYRVDYYFVHASPVCTDIDLGNYMQVSKLGQMLVVIPQIIASAVYPQMSSGENRELVGETVMMLARIFSILFLLLIIFISLIGNWLFPFVFGATFNKMQIPMLLLLPGIFCVSVLVILASFFSGKGNVRVSIYAALLALAVVLAGDYFFVPVYGIIAAALVSTVGYAVNLGYYLFQFKKDYSLSLAYFFKWRKTDLDVLRRLMKKG